MPKPLLLQPCLSHVLLFLQQGPEVPPLPQWQGQQRPSPNPRALAITTGSHAKFPGHSCVENMVDQCRPAPTQAAAAAAGRHLFTAS
jgi:hypothetical protein